MGHTGRVNGIPWVLHVDLDQFIAAVEVLRRPELAGRPIIVGGRGDPAERAVVSTASYEARAFGVGSGMPLRLAARKVPDAVILPVDAQEYLAASDTVMATLRAQPGAVVQVLGWDEAFIGTETEDPEAYARQIQAAVLERTRLHCSVGIGDTLDALHKLVVNYPVLKDIIFDKAHNVKKGYLISLNGEKVDSTTPVSKTDGNCIDIFTAIAGG